MTGERYALRLGNGSWLDKGGAMDPRNKIVSNLQNARLYDSVQTAKTQQTEFIKNRNRFPNRAEFQQKIEIYTIRMKATEVAVGDSFGEEPQEPQQQKQQQQPQQQRPQQKQQREPQQQQRQPQRRREHNELSLMNLITKKLK